MIRIFLSVFLTTVIAMPASAQEEDGGSAMDRSMRQFFEGLLLEMEPTFEDMRAFLEQMGPALKEIMEEVEDWSVYEMPEVLDNGDIIIRRKPDREEEEEEKSKPEALPQIEL